jgi:DNA-binding NarL/FixJ family response regulator
MSNIRILIADDHPMFRNGIKGMLSAVPEFEVVGLATGGQETIELALELQPDIILMDIQMPGLSGIEATRQILAASPHIRILVVTMFEADQSVPSKKVKLSLVRILPKS